MATYKRDELQQMSGAQLSSLCVQVAESPLATSVEADQARDLVNDWKILVGAAKPPKRSAKEEQEIQAKIGKQHFRMVEFLNAVGLPK